MDFGWPNFEIGQRMANGQLLFLALLFLTYGRSTRLKSVGFDIKIL